MFLQSTPVGSTQTGTEVIVSPSRENRERHPTAIKVNLGSPSVLISTLFRSAEDTLADLPGAAGGSAKSIPILKHLKGPLQKIICCFLNRA